MKTARRSLRLYLAALILFALLSCLASASAWATGYGELAKVKGSEAFKVGEKTETDAFGVDSSEGNDFFVGEEPKASEEEYRIREYSPAGTLLGGVSIPKPEGAEPPAYGIEGIAIDAAEKRLYALVLSGHKGLPGDNVPAAGKVYAFKTVPNASKVLEPACSCAGGLLAGEATLNTQSQTLGTSKDALLEPDGIAVDPNPVTHENELVILGKDDERKAGEPQPVFHMAVQHITPAGALGERYVAPESAAEGEYANSPVVTPNGNVYFQRHEPGAGYESIVRVPASSSEAPIPVYRAGSPQNQLIEPLYEFDPSESPASMGDGLSFVTEAHGAGRVYSGAEIDEQVEVDESLKPEGENPGILALTYQEQGTTGSFSEYGWTGGAKTTKSCGIGGIGNEFFPVAAAGEEKVFVLDLAKKEVIEFGPTPIGTGGCPTASAKLVAEVNGTAIGETEKVPAGTSVSLGSLVVQGDVLKVEWEFDEGTPALVETGALAHEWELHPTQETMVTHRFEANGAGGLEPTITETIYTDNLATPEIKLQRKLKLIAKGPQITHDPTNAGVAEGVAVQFTASASGDPKPEVQWEVKRQGGPWESDTSTGDSGAQTDTLTINDAKSQESGNEYRAFFKNSGGSVTSTAATLTVESQAEITKKREKVEEQERIVREAREARERQETKEAQERNEKAAAEQKAAAEKAAAEKAAAEKAAAEKASAEAAAKKKAEEEKAKSASKPPTRAQLLAKALKSCKKLSKGKRLKCELAARKKYGPKSKKKKK